MHQQLELRPRVLRGEFQYPVGGYFFISTTRRKLLSYFPFGVSSFLLINNNLCSWLYMQSKNKNVRGLSKITSLYTPFE